MHGGAYTSEARSWSDMPLYAVNGQQDMEPVLAPGEGGKRKSPVIWKFTSGRLISYHRNQKRGRLLTISLIKNNHQLGLERILDFPGGSGKESTSQCRRHRCEFDPWVGKTPGIGNDNPLQHSCLGNSTTEESRGLQSTGCRVGHN